PLAQTLFGRIFVRDFEATSKTWEAAQVIDRALGDLTLRRVMDALGAKVPAAQAVLTRAMDGDRNGVHAIGVAVHNFVASLDILRDLDATTPEDKAMAAALTAPERVARQGTSVAETTAGRIRPGTLVLLKTGQAASRTLDPKLTFLSNSWSGCPAHAFVPKITRRIWREARGGSGGAA
ncbi:MAG: hypothetical protein AAFX00_03370, partial [Pseudomonadota bacterium]